MRTTKKALIILCFGIPWGICGASTPEEACRVMTEKLAASAELNNMSDFKSLSPNLHIRLHPVKPDNKLQEADVVVGVAYSSSPRKTLDRRWPGFWDWSVAAVLRAWAGGLTKEEFAAQAFVSCIDRYSK